MKRTLIIIGLGLLATGCIQRTITIDSQPQGALVYLNDVEVGRTPTTVPFTFYGVYDVRLSKQGFQTLHTEQKAQAPWWDNPGPDMIAEAMPGTKRVNLQWRYTLEPAPPTDEALTVDRARQMRAYLQQEAAEGKQGFGEIPTAQPTTPADDVDDEAAPATEDEPTAITDMPMVEDETADEPTEDDSVE